MQSQSSSVGWHIVQAGAGTGKTEGLSLSILARAVSLQEELQRTPKIVASTFTEKATAELRERVIQKLSKDAPDWLHKFVQSREDLFISTLHGTFALFLRRYGSYLGLDPEFSIVTSFEVDDLTKQILRQEIQSNVETWQPLFDHFSTLEMVSLFKSLIRLRSHNPETFSEIPDWRSLFNVQFDEQAVKLRNILSVFGDVLEGQECKPHLERLAQTLLNSKLEPKERWQALNDWFEHAPLPDFRKIKDKNLKAEWEPLKKSLLEISGRAFAPNFNDQAEAVYKSLVPLTSQLASLIDEAKLTRGWLTFEDLEIKTYELVSRFPEVRKKIQDAWDFWFLDEYQDTSPLQKRILELIFKPQGNAYFVGDPHQSIYRFRGANPYVFEETLKNIQKAHGKIEKLDTNYRSVPDLITFFNHALEGFKYPPMQLKPKGAIEGTHPCQIHIARDGVDPLDLMVFEIQRLQKLGVKNEDIAILMRTNAHAREVAQKLKEYGIPFSNFGDGGFFSKREIKDFILILRFLVDPHDNITFVGLARSPWIGVSDEVLFSWAQTESKESLWEKYLKGTWDIPGLCVLKESLEQLTSKPVDQVVTNLVEALGLLEFSQKGDPTGLVEANLYKFLLMLRQASIRRDFSLARFVRDLAIEIERGEEKEAEPFVQPDRVNVLTVHKSKGLKFGAVIIPLASATFRSQYESFESDRSGRWAVAIYDHEEDKKTSPLLLKDLASKRKTEEEDEYERLLYVALTRAAEHLALIGTDSQKGWMGCLKISYEDGPHDFGYVVKNWDSPPGLQKENKEKQVAKPTRSLSLMALPGGISKRRWSVTEIVERLEGAQKNQGAAKAFKPDLADSLKAMRFGQALHFVFEQQSYHPNKSWAEVVKLGQGRFPDVDLNKLSPEALAPQGVPLVDLIKNGSAEWPFILNWNGAQIFGQIDLWAEIEGQIWVIDYKSAAKPSDVSKRKARAQLELYSLALAEFRGRKSQATQCAVLYPIHGSADVFKPRELSEIQKDLSQVLKMEE